MGVYFRYSVARRCVVCSRWSRFIEAILMSTHQNTIFNIKKKKKKKKTENYPKLF